MLRLPDDLDDGAVSRSAEAIGIRVPALSTFCVERTDLRGLVIGYGRLHESTVGHAASSLTRVVRSHLGS